eukprot:CAMPEP_0198134338 /NCGR_PEP_ID=MMETSP1442-20131203/60023_1 /TAXON_ID= /ORGANISM="Craspedostauros australis, Strain CCMP3328" /LENGTH=192 /DNA_ID=CAMNT_0043795481 /DNA_START=944 /DNA_END=1522 /DNA_ORIENTATION=+
MFRIASTALKRSAVRASASSNAALLSGVRSFTSAEDATTAADASKLSGYHDIDYTINEDATVFDAVQKFAAFNIGCLATTGVDGNLTGVVSERDYISKIALLGRTSKDTTIKQISTPASKLVTAKPSDSVDACMEKMLNSNVRHLLLVSEDGELHGMISIKDLVKSVVKEKEQTIRVLSDFALGKGGHFGAE